MSSQLPREIAVVGGVYTERCMRPTWDEIYGSAGRAASAIASMDGSVRLFSYCDSLTRDVIESRADIEGFKVDLVSVAKSPKFFYHHGMENPRIFRPLEIQPSIKVESTLALSFGMLEGDAVVSADRTVYDPQNSLQPRHFNFNGSRTKELAIVLNRNEARLLAGATADVQNSKLVTLLATKSSADVVIIKLGPLGAIAYEDGKVYEIPAFRSNSVWKIGSGDNFAAHFAYRWLLEEKCAEESALLASKATAYYCQSRGFATPPKFDHFDPEVVKISKGFSTSRKPLVYLAGPFFTMAQLWLIEQVRESLRALGLDVFSPFHDVGHGSARDVVLPDLKGIEKADLVFAILDGMDPGTIFEIGYSKAIGKPVCIYCENESVENQKMMIGTECTIQADFVSAVYETFWLAAGL